MNKFATPISGCMFLLLYLFVIFPLLSLLAAVPTYYLWNWLIPVISSGAMPEITFFQAWGLNFLCSILFKSSSTSSNEKS